MFALEALPVELLDRVIGMLRQADKLSVALTSKRLSQLALKHLYRKIYLNDSHIVLSPQFDIGGKWSVFVLSADGSEDETRKAANIKLRLLIQTLRSEKLLNLVEWVRLNWDLDIELQRELSISLCRSISFSRFENVTDMRFLDVLEGNQRLVSLDVPPPNPMAEQAVSPEYIPRIAKFLESSVTENLNRLTLFMDPVKMFGHVYRPKDKLKIVELKLHLRLEFYPHVHFQGRSSAHVLSDVFDTNTLHTVTMISWSDEVSDLGNRVLDELCAFTNVQDLSLISMVQEKTTYVKLLCALVNLRRIKMDLIESGVPQPTSHEIVYAMLLNCRKLEFLDIRADLFDPPIVSIRGGPNHGCVFRVKTRCKCAVCNDAYNRVLLGKVFVEPGDYFCSDHEDICRRDPFTGMRLFSLLPYSKAFDMYPCVRTQSHSSMDHFVKWYNEKLTNNFTQCLERVLTSEDMVQLYFMQCHSMKRTIEFFMGYFSGLRWLSLNDIPLYICEDGVGNRIAQPVFYSNGYTSNINMKDSLSVAT